MNKKLIKPFSKRPQTARAPPSCDKELYSLRAQLNSIKKEPISSDDIIKLKLEKQRLLEEKTRLKTKITHFSDKSKKPAPVRSKQVQQSLERQIKTLEALVEERKEELQAIINSDKAAEISELQEESKILMLEIIRLQNSKKESEQELKKAEERVDFMNSEYSDSNLIKRKKNVLELEKEIIAQTDRNERLRQDIALLKEQQKQREESEENQKLLDEIAKIKEKINEEKKAIKDLDSEIDSTRRSQVMELADAQNGY